MTTLIKKDQIATGEFIKNPLPEDPWTSTTDTASLAAIAAKIAANGGGLPDILMGGCDRNIYQQSEISVYGDTTLIDIIAEKGYCMLFLRFETDISAGEPIYSNNNQFTLYVNGSAVAAGDIESGDLCLLYCSGLDLYLVSNDRWLKDIQGKQDELVGSGAGQNIKTINSQSLLGSGNIDIVGVCDSAEYADALVADVDGFVLRDCAVAFIRFTHGIKTNANSTYPKTLDINGTGPKSLMVWGSPNDFSYAGSWLVGDHIVASVVYLEGSQNFSEGYYIFGTSLDLNRMRWLYNNKQGNLPTFVENAGKVLGVNDNADGLVWKTLGYEKAYTVVSTTPQNELTLSFAEKTHHHVKMETGVRAVTIVVDICNSDDNILTVDFTGPRSEQLTTCLYLYVKRSGSYVTRLITSDSVYGGTIEKMHIPSSTRVGVEYYLHSTNNSAVNHASFVIRAASFGSVTYGVVNATAMLCSDITT